MRYKSVHIHMEEVDFDCKVRNVKHFFQIFHLLVIPFIIYFVVELNLILSCLDCFVQEFVLLVVISFHYISQADSQLYS